MLKLIDWVKEYQAATEERFCRTAGYTIYVLIEHDLKLYVFGKVDNFQDAEDVLQETLKSIFDGLFSFNRNTEGEFWSWCYTIAWRRVLDYRQKRDGKPQEFPLDDAMEIIESSAHESPITTQIRLDLEITLQLVFKTKPECRDLLWDRHVMRHKFRDIADRMQLKEATVARRVERCLEFAQIQLRKTNEF